MPPVLAPRRLRSPQEAFALCQRPLPAHLHPHLERRPPVRRPVFATRRIPAFAGVMRSAAAGRVTAPASDSTNVVAAPMRTRANPLPQSATTGSTASAASAAAATFTAASSATSVTGSTASSFGRSAPRPQSPRLLTGQRPSASFQSHGSAALAPQPSVDRRSTPTLRTAAGTQRPADLRVVPSRSTKDASGGRGNRGNRAVKPARSARPAWSAVWKRRLRALGAFGLFGVALTVSFSAIAMHSQLAGRQMKLTTLRVDVDAAEREHQMLRLKVAELDTPEQVVTAAYSLGLTGASEVEFLPTASTIPTVVTAGPLVPDRP